MLAMAYGYIVTLKLKGATDFDFLRLDKNFIFSYRENISLIQKMNFAGLPLVVKRQILLHCSFQDRLNLRNRNSMMHSRR